MELCSVCGVDVEEGSHGKCWRDLHARLLQVIAGQRMEISELRERLIDCGALRRGEK